jgi:hypothetical protein
MAEEKPSASSSRDREAPEQQDQSIKARKRQLFEEREPVRDGSATQPFSVYLRATAGAPMSQGAKVVIWTLAVVVVLLFLAALFGPRPTRPRAGPRVSTAPAFPAAVGVRA